MEKIRVNEENVYKVEVNDKGEYVEIDLLDIEFPIKCINASKTLKKETEIYNNKIHLLEKQYKDNPKTYLYKRIDIDRIYCKKMREMIDELLGEGASQKIFGSKNRIGMFDEFFDKFMPILDNVQINFEKIRENLINKYKDEVKI